MINSHRNLSFTSFPAKAHVGIGGNAGWRLMDKAQSYDHCLAYELGLIDV